MQPGLRRAVLRGPKMGLPENPAKAGPGKRASKWASRATMPKLINCNKISRPLGTLYLKWFISIIIILVSINVFIK